MTTETAAPAGWALRKEDGRIVAWVTAALITMEVKTGTVGICATIKRETCPMWPADAWTLTMPELDTHHVFHARADLDDLLPLLRHAQLWAMELIRTLEHLRADAAFYDWLRRNGYEPF